MASDALSGGEFSPKERRVILVLSGKGGVGKSTVAVQLALGLKNLGHKVGLLDVDLCGPSIPRMLNLEKHKIHSCAQGWVPVFSDASQMLSVMSIGFLLQNRDDAIVWRGPKKTAMIRQFLSDVCWPPEIEYLVIDTPPGTSDEHIALMETLKAAGKTAPPPPDGVAGGGECGALLVTTPQAVAVGDVRREITFCRKTAVHVLGLVENMSGFVCPTCKDCTDIFSKGGGAALAEYAKVPFLGSIPLDPNLSECSEKGRNYSQEFPLSPVSAAINEILTKLTNRD